MALLAGYRVLDDTAEWGLMAGRLLADLGADVVQLEPPDGSPARACAPVDTDGGRSAYWAAFAANKRGLALDRSGPDGRAALAELVAAADFFLTSQDPETLAADGLGWEQLSARHPSLVYVHVSPFGLTGPKSTYAASDLVVWAASGALQPNRDGDRPPVRLSSEQARLHAGADAACGALVAHHHRMRTGRGQLVEVSAQVSSAMATISRMLAHAVHDTEPGWQFEQGPLDRSGSGSSTPSSQKKWRCRDGWVEWHLAVGPGTGRFTANLCAWLRDEGVLPDDLAAVDWDTLPEQLERGEADPSVRDRLRGVVGAFFAGKTKEEVNEAALTYRLSCSGIRDIADVVAAPHLEARDVWVRLGGDGAAPLPGRFATVSVDAYRHHRRAPRLGEHTAEVLAEWRGTVPVHSRHLPAPPPGPAPAGALDDLKVLDLSWVVAGPMVGRALADFGATVVRVESATRPDVTRGMKPLFGGTPGLERSSVYANCNAGKRSISLDLRHDEARLVVAELAGWADVLIESFAPGVMARWGLGYDRLAEVNPGLVMLSSSLGGQHGPLARLAGFGNTGASLSGFQALGGWPDRPPLGPFGPYTDYVAPRFGLAMVLAALDRRRATGTGCAIDLSQVECGVYFLSPEIAHHHATGAVAARAGNADPLHAPHGVFPTLDDEAAGAGERFVAVAVTTDDQWQALARRVGGEGLAADRRYATAGGRLRHAADLERLVADWCATRRADEVERELQAVGVPAHRSATSADFCDDPQFAHRHHLRRLPHPELATTVVEGPRYTLSSTPGVVAGAAPVLGAESRWVLRELLGWTPEAVDALAASGALA